MEFGLKVLFITIEVLGLVLGVYFLAKEKPKFKLLVLIFLICFISSIFLFDFPGQLEIVFFLIIAGILMKKQNGGWLKSSGLISYSIFIVRLSHFLSQINFSLPYVMDDNLLILMRLVVALFINVFLHNNLEKLFQALDVDAALDKPHGLILMWFINVMVVVYYTSWFVLERVESEGVRNFVPPFFTFFFIATAIIMMTGFVSVIDKRQQKIDETDKAFQLAARAWGAQQEETQHLDNYAQGLKEHQGAVEKTKHNYKYILPSIIYFAEEDDMEGLRDYLRKNEKTIEELQNVMMDGDESSDVIKISGSDLNPIRGILFKMLAYAKEMKVDMTVEVHDVIEFINFEKMPLVNILGSWLENAIEAAVLTDEREVHISFVKMENSPIMSDCVIVKVSNSCESDLPSFDAMRREGFSTKGENRGYGLSNVSIELKKSENIEHVMFYEDGNFVQELVMFNE